MVLFEGPQKIFPSVDKLFSLKIDELATLLCINNLLTNEVFIEM